MASARFPAVPAAAGHYESFYLKAAHPSQPRGLWLRYTVHKPPGAAATGSLWFTLFDREVQARTLRREADAARGERSGPGVDPNR